MAPPADQLGPAGAAARRLLVWGGGGHGKVVAELARLVGYEVVGFVDADPGKLDRVVEPGGARVVLTEAALRSGRLPRGVEAVVVAIGDNTARLACLGSLAGVPSPALIHPASVVSPSAQVGEGAVVFAGAVVNAGARLGRGVIVNTGAIVEHDCVVADGAHLSPGAVLAGEVRLGERSWVGAGAVVVRGAAVGKGAVVGAGAVVLHDVEDLTTVVGVPARPISRESR